MVDFCALFIDQDADDEEDSSLVEALTEFKAWAARTKVERKATGNVLGCRSGALHQRHRSRTPIRCAKPIRECFFPTIEPGQRVSPFAVGSGSKAGSASRYVAMA